jgi:hypothetical protein
VVLVLRPVLTRPPVRVARSTAAATGQLTLHEVSRPMIFAVSGRRVGSALEVAGGIPVTFSGWSLADHGVGSSSLVLHRGVTTVTVTHGRRTAPDGRLARAAVVRRCEMLCRSDSSPRPSGEYLDRPLPLPQRRS